MILNDLYMYIVQKFLLIIPYNSIYRLLILFPDNIMVYIFQMN